ncbi:MAG: hypothetical protein KC414_15235 [Romboutsia sp.]|nr:hypothetical protein [Romboutsia sp.]
MKRIFEDITNVQFKKVKLTIYKSSHRIRLIRWLYEVCIDFNYNIYTYLTTIKIIENFIDKNGFDAEDYQLIGITSLLISSKIEESNIRSLKEYSIVTDLSCTVKDIINKEREILEILDYNIKITLPQTFLNIEYFKSNFAIFTIEERTEIFNCIVSAQIERFGTSKKMFSVYNDSIREMEEILKDVKRLKDDTRFYLEHNKKTKDILNKLICLS